MFGASGGTGQAIICRALERGLKVKAFVRRLSSIRPLDRQQILQGDVADYSSVKLSIAAGDLVVVTLGNSQNPIKRMLGEARTTPSDVCEVGTRNVIAAMIKAGATRLIVVSAFGIGDTRKNATWLLKLFYALLLREQMADKERQEMLVRASGLDWTIVQPVALTAETPTGRWLASRTGGIGKQKISRGDVADFIVAELLVPAYIGATVSLSSSK